MEKVICKKCGGRFDSKDVFSWGLCKDCDKAISLEVKRLKARMTRWGGAALFFLLLLMSLLFSYMTGTDAYGNYHLLAKGRKFNETAITPIGLLCLSIVCSILESIFVPFYFSYRQRVKTIEKEAFGANF